MALKTKIVLSGKELDLVKNADWILTKHGIIQKVHTIFNDCLPVIEEFISPQVQKMRIPFEPPKISKGENYAGLPYVILDHPRLFSKEDVFAIRTMFWWGNFFSVTLHTSGIYKNMFQNNITKNIDSLPDNFYLCVSHEQWHHHFNSDNYIAIRDLPESRKETLINSNSFIKIAGKYELENFNNIDEDLTVAYKSFGLLLG